ncbi:MAG: mandelate racemase/muconate lactonizing enzyme family protein [Candidatus Hermodarchaeota archaeon]
MNNKIVRIELTPLQVPFKEAVRKAMGEGEGALGMAIPAEEAWLGGDFVIVKLICQDGTEGLGESFVWLPESGVSPEQIIDAIKGGKSTFGLANYLLGESPFNIQKINFRMDSNIARSDNAKGLLDMACYDLMGKLTNLPACCFMGGRNVEEIPLAALIPLGSPMLMRGIARSYFKKGYRTLRLKLGKSIKEDMEICQVIRKTFGSKVRLRVDYNQAYSPSQAVKAIKSIEPFGIGYAEQPVKIDDYLGMAYVQKRVDTPLMAHEGYVSLKDFITLVELNAVEVFGINSERPGGVTKALIGLDYAISKGLSVVLHNQPLGIASAMHIHFHAGRYYSIEHATELFGQEMMEDDLIKEPLDYSNGTAKVPKKPGWGIELDEKALEKYATAPTTTIEKK